MSAGAAYSDMVRAGSPLEGFKGALGYVVILKGTVGRFNAAVVSAGAANSDMVRVRGL